MFAFEWNQWLMIGAISLASIGITVYEYFSEKACGGYFPGETIGIYLVLIMVLVVVASPFFL